MKMAKKIKKVSAIFLAATVMLMAIPFVGVSAATNDDFNENQVVLRLGIMSDLHISYDSMSVQQIKQYVSNYANSVATLNNMAGGNLDALLLCGDYTSGGGSVQGESFASASKAIMDAINEGKNADEKTKFIMTYGNHDTEWNGQMNYSEWESLLNNYDLLDDVSYGPANSGSYSGIITKGGKTFHIFSVETEKYYSPTNTFRTDVLEWLDNGLSAATKSDPNSYVYVISHGPIKESGVYGSDINFDKNAKWGTAEAGYTGKVNRDGNNYDVSSDIDSVLKKYPQVMYLSGHTHFTNALESTIMSKDYTAITVSSSNQGDLVSDVSDYLDGLNSQLGSKPGYALYLEVDANGNQRIKRVENPASSASTTITYSREITDAPNPCQNSGQSATLNGVVVDSVTIDSTSTATTLSPWIMSAPSLDKSHLVKYSAEARRTTPVFANEASVEVSDASVSGTTFTANVSYDAATCSNNIIRYNISLLDNENNVIDTRWALGNWTNNSQGVIAGTSHKDATKFGYSSVEFKCPNSKSYLGYSVQITAVDEFGGTASIDSQPISTEPTKLLENRSLPVYENMFDVTPDRATVAANQDGVTFSTDANGNLVTQINSNFGYRNAVYMVSESKYNAIVTDTTTKAPFSNWAYPGTDPQNLTDLTADDTFVYETDFQSDAGDGNAFFHIRTPDVNIGDDSASSIAAWRTDYTGIVINNGGVFLGMCGAYRYVSNAFMFDDTDVHHMKVISSPKLISIYIDGETICENYEFNPQAYANEKIDGTEYAYSGIFKSNKMIPTMAIRVGTANGGRVLTVTNQQLYYYYPSDESNLYTEVDRVVENNMFDGMTTERAFPLSKSECVAVSSNEGVINVSVDFTSLSSEQWTNICYVTSANNFAKYGKNAYMPWGSPGSNVAKYFTDLSEKDTFVYEADFSAPILAGNQVYFHVRTPDINTNVMGAWQTDYTGVHITSTGAEIVMCKSVLATSDAFKLNNNNVHHIKIYSTPNDITVYVDGAKIFDKVPFNKQAGINAGIYADAFASAKMIPTMAQYVMFGAWNITNQQLRKSAVVTPYNSSNQNLVISNGELYSGFALQSNCSFVVDDNNFFADTTYTSIPGSPWTQERYDIFGKNNSKLDLSKKKSYVFSGLATANNASLTDSTSGNTYPSRLDVYLGEYNSETVFAFIQDTTWYLYVGSKQITTIDLAASIGYSVGDTVRVTTLLNPFGFSSYLNGTLLYTYNYENPNLIDYSTISLGIGGTVGAWRDIVFYENTDDGELYAEQLKKIADKVSRVKGLYFSAEDTAALSQINNAIASFKGTDYSELYDYVGILENILSNAKVVNNLVREGLTSVGEDTFYSFNGQTFDHFGINLFSGKTCPITVEDKWQIDFDANIKNIGASNVRIIFAITSWGGNINNSDGGIMIQDNYAFGVENNGNGGIAWAGLGAGNATIAQANTSWHFTFKVEPTAKGLSTHAIVTSLDGQTTYFDNTYVDTNVSSVAPHIYYRTCDFEMNNLCISYDLTDDIAALSETYNDDTSTEGIALVCINKYNKAKTDASSIINNVGFYTRDEIRSAKDAIVTAVNSFEKNGDVNLDKSVNLIDLVRLKKIFAGVADETITSDVDGDGDLLANDLASLISILLNQ